MIKYPMKKSFLLCICSLALAGGLFAQVSTETPIASPASTAATAATSQAALPSTSASALPTATASSASSDLADKIHRKLEKKLGRKHGIIIDADNKDGDHVVAGDSMPAEVIPLVGIVFLSIFGAPVLIVVMIG